MLFEERPIIQLNNRIRRKYLVFRVYEDPIQIKPYQPPDRGYYFDMVKCDIKIIRYTLEDNGFRELSHKEHKKVEGVTSQMALINNSYKNTDGKQLPSLIWYVSSIKNHVYNGL